MSLIKALTLDWVAANIQRGTVNFVAVGFKDVTFPVEFAAVPRITVTFGAVINKPIAAINKTTTGFRIISNGAFTGPVDWIAVIP